MIIATVNIFDELVQWNFSWPQAPDNLGFVDAKLAKQIIAPSENLSIRGQQPREGWATHNLDDRVLKIHLVG